MAKVKLNPILEGIRGQVSGLVFKPEAVPGCRLQAEG